MGISVRIWERNRGKYPQRFEFVATSKGQTLDEVNGLVKNVV